MTLLKGLVRIISADQGEKLMTILRKEWDVKKAKKQGSKTLGRNSSVEDGNLYAFMSENFVTK